MQELNQTVLKLSSNIDKLLSNIQEKEQLIDDLQQKLSAIQAKKKELELENAELKQLIQHYKTVKALSSSDTKEVKRKLNKMVREIDDCIAKLNR